MGDQERGIGVVKELIEIVNKMSEISDFRFTVKKQCGNLASRLKLLTPMFEEIRDSRESISHDCVEKLDKLKEAMVLALELLRFGSQGSKIYMVWFRL